MADEQYKTFINSKCRDQLCDECPLKYVTCQRWADHCWIKHKDLYSDKFLDQEIEVEEDD